VVGCVGHVQLPAPETHTSQYTPAASPRQVWDASSGGIVFEVGAKSVNKEAWPLLHWSQGDVSLFHGVTNTVHQYSRADGFKSECVVGRGGDIAPAEPVVVHTPATAVCTHQTTRN
jgi:hypothetical protein